MFSVERGDGDVQLPAQDSDFCEDTTGLLWILHIYYQ